MPDKYMIDARQSKTDIFNPVAWEQFKGMAATFVKSGALPKDTNAEQLVVKMQAGYEMGMKPFEAIRALYIVNGMISIGGRDLILQLRRHGWSVKYEKESDQSVTATVKRGDEEYTDTFTYKEAQASGWTTTYNKPKPAWLPGANRNLKMRYAVISKIVKSYIPEVIGSVVDVYEIAQDTVPLYQDHQVQVVEDANDPATTTQIETLKNLGVAVPDEITKSQAVSLIQEAMNETEASQANEPGAKKTSDKLSSSTDASDVATANSGRKRSGTDAKSTSDDSN